MVGFIFGGSTGETPESLKRKRSVAEALAARTSTAPKNVGEGLSAIGNALLYRSLMKKVEAGDAAARQGAETDFAPLLSGGMSPVANALMSPGAKTAGIPLPDAAGEVAATSPKVDISGDKQTFIDSLLPAAVEEGKRTGVDPRIIVAQAAQETGWGKSAPGNNYFGIKSHGQSGGQTLATNEVVDGKTVRINDSFRQFGSPADSVRGYGDFITQNPRYKPLREAQGLDAQLKALQASGYATDPNYSRSVGAIARGINLPTEVASLDPPSGIGTAFQPTTTQPDPAQAAQVDAAQGQINGGAAAIEAIAPSSGYRDPMVSAPNGRSAVANALMSPTPQISTNSSDGGAPANPSQSAGPSKLSPVAAALMSPRPEAQQPQQVAQAEAGYFPAAPNPVGQSGPSMQQIMRVLNNPNATEAQRAYAASLLERQQKLNDPATKLDLEVKRAQLDALRGKPTKTWQKLDDTTLFNPETGETQNVGPTPDGKTGFRFNGKSVEAQALNGLMDANQLTPEQAQQLGAGKTITGPNGEIIFMTPQGVFGKTSQDAPAMPLSAQGTVAQPASVDIFGDVPERSATPAANAPAVPQATSPTTQPSQAPPQRSGMIPLTEPKVTIDESKAGGFADRMTQSGALVNQFGDAGLSTFDQTITNSPYVPSVIANNLVGDDFQKYDQARRDFINAQLRRESGAVISPEEFDNANRQYFPQPGDKTEVLEQKRKNRETVIGAMIRDAGPTYKKPVTAASGAPEKGTVEGGYRFKGGDPADQSNWEKVQ